MDEGYGVGVHRRPVAVGGGVFFHPRLNAVLHDVAVGVPHQRCEQQTGADALVLGGVVEAERHGVDGVGAVGLVVEPLRNLFEVALGEHVLILHSGGLVVHDVPKHEGQSHGIVGHGLLDDVHVGGPDVVGPCAEEAVIDSGQFVAAVALSHHAVHPRSHVAALRVAHVDHRVAVDEPQFVEDFASGEESVDVRLGERAALEVGLRTVHGVAEADAVGLNHEIL